MKKSNKVFFVGLGSIFVLVFVMTMPFRVLNAESKSETFVSVTTSSPGKKIVGNDRLVTKGSTLESFDAINVSGNFEVTLTPGAKSQLSVTADENIMPYLNIGVAQKTLNLGAQSGVTLFASQPQKAIVTTNGVKKIKMMGNNKLEAKKIMGESVVLDLAGNEEIYLAGEVKNLTLNVFGKTIIDAKDLKAENVTVAGAGNADITVHATKKLMLTISGKSDIKYYGNPEVTKSAFGFVTVQKLGDLSK